MKFIANLNGTILCPYQILLDVFEQIPNSPTKIKGLAFRPICDLNSTNDWINLESLGKPVALRAKALIDVLGSLLNIQGSENLALDIYISDGGITSDNVFSLLYLAQIVHSLDLTFYTDSENHSQLQTKIEALTNIDNVFICFKNELTLEEPSQQTDLKNARENTLKTIGFYFADDFLGQDEIPESTLNQLIGFSWMCLKSGAYEIPCRLLEKAKNNSNVSQAMQEQLFMHLLMVRFFSHQYALIATSEFPEQFTALEPSDVRTLQFLTAYSATLSRNLEVAQKFFEKCHINAQMPLSDETSLFQLNLFALSRVLLGQTDTAFELEFRIKDFIEKHQIETVGLKYVNFINIARLYKKTKEFDLSLDYYNKAYNEISGGGYATSDYIYYNMNLGSLFEASGNNKLALNHWIKAAMHWLACTNKYELSWRPRIILCGEQLSEIAKPLPVDKAHTFLFNKIETLCTLCQLDVTNQAIRPYQFSDDSVNTAKEYCFINSNILMYTASTAELPSSQKTSPAEQKLSTLVSQYLQSVMEIPADQNVLMIDTHLDASYLQQPEEAVAYARLSQCKSCYFNGQWLKLDGFKTLKSMKASLSRVIESITPTEKGLSVLYKRSFLNKTLLDQDEINWVNELSQNESLNLESMTSSDWTVMQQLAKKRIVNFTYPTK